MPADEAGGGIRLPLYFNQLVLQTTWACTARCAMCYQSAGPKGSDRFGRASLGLALLQSAIDQAANVHCLEPRLNIVGGEALIEFEPVLALIKHARSSGFLDVSVTTNGFWGQDTQRAAEVCGQLKAAGLTQLDLSWDRWRRPFISGDTFSTCLEQASAAGLTVHLRLLTNLEDTVADLLEDLRPEAIALASEIFSETVARTGRAATELETALVPTTSDLSGACFRDLRLTVNPAGDVYPCCSGLDQTRSLAFGNVREDTLEDIASRMDTSELLRKIVFEGIACVVQMLPDTCQSLANEQSSICSLCWSVFSDEEAISALKVVFPDEHWLA